MLKICDNMMLLHWPDGRVGLADTGASGADIIAETEQAPVEIRGTPIRPLQVPVQLNGIARTIGAPRLDMLIGATILSRGFTAELRKGTFEFSARCPMSDEETVAVLPYIERASGLIASPFVRFHIGGEAVFGIFDTGAPYSLWKFRSDAPGCEATTTRTDFHVGAGVELVEFPVLMRKEKVRIGAKAFDLDVAFLPDSWPSIYPTCVLGMDVLQAVGATTFVLDPVARELRFYRQAIS